MTKFRLRENFTSEIFYLRNIPIYDNCGCINFNSTDVNLFLFIVSPPQSSSDPIRVWSSCLGKCSEVMESCVSVFSEVKEQTVLEEIAQSEEGRNKLKGMDLVL